MALAGANPTSTAGSPIRSRGVRKASSMRSVEAVADFENDGVRKLTASSEQLEVLLLSPCWRGSGGHGLLARMGPERHHPVNAKPLSRWRFAPALTGCRRPGSG